MARWSLKMKAMATFAALTLAATALCATGGFLVLNKPLSNKILILETDIHIDKDGVEILCDPPLTRSGRAASIMLAIEGDWAVSPPWEGLSFSDGAVVDLVVQALADDGRIFKSAIIGQSGTYVDVRFRPQIPKTAVIKKLRIIASEEVRCRKLIWHDFDYL